MYRLIQFLNRAIAIGLFICCFATIIFGQSQSTTASLTGKVTDETGAVITNAAVSIKSTNTNYSRSVVTDQDGIYKFIALPPGHYLFTAEGQGFEKRVTDFTLLLGQIRRFDISLRVAENTNYGDVEIKPEPNIIDDSNTTLTDTINEQRIQNLPINGRNFTNFALTNSQIARSSGTAIASIPTTGLSFGGQSPIFNLVQVDGSDNIDNTTNSARATVSQEAVSEFQIISGSGEAEFGRAAGGVINIVLRSGSNEFHGNVFGYLRHRSIQARNALAFPPPGSPSKPSFTRGQYGFTLGGPIKKDQTYFFLSVDQNRRQEPGFNQIGIDPSIFDLTPAQKAFIAANSNNPIGGVYAQLATSGAGVARNGIDPITGQPIFFSTFLISNGAVTAPIPASFKPLGKVANVYPTSEKFTFYLAKIDHQLSQTNNLSISYRYTPTSISGLQTSIQFLGSSLFGLNDVSRTSAASVRDTSVVVKDTQSFGSNSLNQFIFNFGRRGTAIASGPGAAIDIPGAGFFGRDTLSTVDRTERRYQIKDDFIFTTSHHTFGFGGDFSYIDAPTRIEFDSGGHFVFGDLSLAPINSAFASAPPLTAVQAYGLGFPQTYIQFFRRPKSNFDNKTLGLYGQDSWNITPRIKLNYGLRYDLELTPQFRARGVNTSQISLTPDQVAAAERLLGVVQGVPRDKNNFAPRIGLAIDPTGSGKTVIRAAYGIHYDHIFLLAGHASDIVDGVDSPQLITVGGLPFSDAPLNATQIFQGTVIPGVTPGIDAGAVYLPNESRFDPNSNFPGYGFLLPILLELDRNFVYGYTHQANLTIEREISRDSSFTISYLFTGGRKLARYVDHNVPDANKILSAGGINAITVANNFFRPSGPNPIFIPTANPVPFGSTSALEASATSSYHALVLNYNKRYSRFLQTLISYTYSKSIDSVFQPQDNAKPGLERSLSVNDLRHRFVFSAIATSPFKQNSSRGLELLLAETTLSSILDLSSGRPFNILTGVDTNFDFSNLDRPEVDPQTGALSLPAFGTAGSLGRNAGISPGFASLDLRLTRDILFGERVKLSLIAEGFNMLNRVNVSSVNNGFRAVKFDEGRFKSPAIAVFDPRQFQLAIRISF